MARGALRYGLLAYAFFLPLLEGPAQIACVVVLVALLFGLARAPDEGSGAGPGAAPAGTWIPGLLLLAWALAGYSGVVEGALRGDRLSSEDTTRPLLALGYFVGVWLATRAGPERLVELARAFGAGALISAVYGLLQVGVGALPLDRLLLKNARSPQVWVPGKVGQLHAASGLFYNRLKLGHTGILALALLGPLALRLRKDGGPRRGFFATAIAGVVILLAVGLSHARMALVAAAIGFVVAALLLGERKRAVLAGAIAPIVAFGLYALVPQGIDRMRAAGSDLDVRLHMFRTALQLFCDHPWLGVGHGFYRRIVGEHWDGIGMDIDAHNFVLHVLSESGLIGGVALFSAVGVALVRVGRVIARDPSDIAPRAWLFRFAFTGLAMLVGLGFTHVFTHHASVFLLFSTMLGIAAASASPRAPAEPSG